MSVMDLQTNKAWPPPPDLASLQELVRDADVEGLIAGEGAPPDEYDPEAALLFAAVQDLPTADLTVATLLPKLQSIWRKSFSLSDSEIARRESALRALAAQIERFFGPAAEPQTRTQPG